MKSTIVALAGAALFAIWILLESFSLKAIAQDQCGRQTSTVAAYSACMDKAVY